MTNKRPTPLGKMIDTIWALREKKRALNTQLEAVEAEIATQEQALLERMDHEGVDKSTGKCASVSVAEHVIGNITDWDEFIKFVKKTGYFHLFQRRITDTACRELWEARKTIPGVEPFTKRKINIRTLS